MPINQIANGELGLDVRNKLNAVIDAINALDPISRDFVFTALSDDDDLQNMTLNADAKTSVSVQNVNYVTGAYTPADTAALYNMQINGVGASGGSLAGIFVQAPDIGGLDSIVGLVAGGGVACVAQLIEDAANETVGLVDGVDELADLLNPAVNTSVFVADNDTLVIGADATFDELRVILSTDGSSDSNLTYEYSTGVGAWSAFTPGADSTNGFQNSGLIFWDADNLAGWADGDGAGNFLIRMTRTTNNVPTTPVVQELAFNNTSLHIWDKDGILSIHQIVLDGNKTGTLASPPTGLAVGEVWADTTDSAVHPIVRQSVNGTP